MRKLLLILICFVVTQAVETQEIIQTLTLESAIDRVLSYNIDIQKTAIDLATASYAAEHTWSTFFPTINVGANASYRSNLISNGGLSFQETNGSWAISATVSLQLNAGIPYAIKQLKLAAERQGSAYLSAKQKLELSVTGTFYGLLASQYYLKLLEENLAFAQNYKDRMYESFQAGITGEIAYLRSQLEVETARTTLNSEKIRYDDNMRQFLVLLGLDPEQNVALQGEIQADRIEVDSDSLVQKYLASHPDVKAKQQEIERQELAKKQSDFKTYAPTIELSYGLNLSSTNRGSFTDPFSLGIAVNIPINPWIPGTQANQDNRKVKSDLEKAYLDLKNTEQQTMLNIKLKAATLNNSWQNIENLRTRASIAQRSFDLQERDYKAGLIGYSTLEDSQKDLYEANYQLLQGQVSYCNAVIDLAGALNVSLNELVTVK